MEQNTKDGDRKFLRIDNKFLPAYITRRYALQESLLLFECLQKIWFTFVHVEFVSVPGATVSYCGLLFPLFSDPLKLCRKLAVVRTREYFPCFVWYCKWFIWSRMNRLPSVDSVPHECPCSHLSNLRTKMDPTDCVKTAFSRLTRCDLQASKRQSVHSQRRP
jgi:hypothetical protein